MALTRIIGNVGVITLPAVTHDAVIARWNASFPRVLSDVTGFADATQHNRLGLISMTGQASGVPIFDASNTSVGISDRAVGGSALTLTQATGCTVVSTAVFNNISLSSDKQGDAAVTFDFANGDHSADAITVTWDESA
jgi:hypothetical protein